MNEQDSNIFLQALYGPISNVVINNNWVGGLSNGNNSYNIYVESRFGYPITGVSITNDYINKAYYGYFSIVNSSPTMSGNVQFRHRSWRYGAIRRPVDQSAPDQSGSPENRVFSNDTGTAGDCITSGNTL